jgi:hypothetical protein
MQKHTLPSSSTSRNQDAHQSKTEQVNSASAMPASVITTPASPSSFAAALNLPDLSQRKEMAFKKQTVSRGDSKAKSSTRNNKEESSSDPPASSSRHSRSSVGLSGQLNGPLSALEGITASLRSRGKKDFDQDEPLWKGTVKKMTVGRCASTSSSALTAYPDRLEYKFHSSSGDSIAMIMFFRDMTPSTVVLDKTTLVFHIETPLIQYSSADYSHGDVSDLLSLSFFSIQDAREFSRSVRSFLPS